MTLCITLLFFLRSWHPPLIHAQTYSLPHNTDQSAPPPSNINQQIADLFLINKNRALLAGPRIYLRCATPLIQAARQYPELLEESNRFILYRPTGSNVSAYYGGGVAVWSYENHLEGSMEEGHFRLYYTEDNSGEDGVQDADGQQNTIPESVTQFAHYFEQAWSYLIGTLGYDEPIETNEKIEIFILDISCYGMTTADSEGLYIMVNNDYQWVKDNLDNESKETGAMKITSVHEFFHVVQAGYDNWPNDSSNLNRWWEENTSTWIEDELHDEVNDYINYLGWPYEDDNDNGQWDNGQYYPAEVYFDIWGTEKSDTIRSKGWFDYPHVSLNKTGNDEDCPFSNFEYGGIIWAKYLAEKYGAQIIRNIFEGQKTGKSAFSSIQTILILKGSSLPAEVKEFKKKILLREFEEGNSYPLVRHAANFDQYPAQFNSESFYDSEHGGDIGNLDHLAAHYLGFHAPQENGAMGNIHFTFTKTNGAAQLSCLLMLKTKTGLWEKIDIPLNPLTSSGEITISGFGNKAAYQTIVAIPMNISTSSIKDNASFEIEGIFEPKPYYNHTFQEGMNLFSPAIPEDQSLDSHQFLLQYFTPASLSSLKTFDKQTGQWLKNIYTEAPDSYAVTGPSFSLTQGGINILYLNSPQTITLEASTTSASPSLTKGINFLSYSPQMLNETVSNSFKLFQNLDNTASVIHKKNNHNGKWETTYHFFQKKAGINFAIIGGKTFMFEIIKETP